MLLLDRCIIYLDAGISRHAITSCCKWIPAFFANERQRYPLYNFPIENGFSYPPVQCVPRDVTCTGFI